MNVYVNVIRSFPQQRMCFHIFVRLYCHWQTKTLSSGVSTTVSPPRSAMWHWSRSHRMEAMFSSLFRFWLICKLLLLLLSKKKPTYSYTWRELATWSAEPRKFHETNSNRKSNQHNFAAEIHAQIFCLLASLIDYAAHVAAVMRYCVLLLVIPFVWMNRYTTTTSAFRHRIDTVSIVRIY